MNAGQFYYVHNVLGVSTVIQPEGVRSAYRLHNNSIEKPDFIFFCEQIKTVEDKILIQKIAKAIGSSRELIIEVLNRSGFISKNGTHPADGDTRPAGGNTPPESVRKHLKGGGTSSAGGDTPPESGDTCPEGYSSLATLKENLQKPSYTILDNLLTRILPKGFVIFGQSLSQYLIGNRAGNLDRKISRSLFLSTQETLSVPGCVLSPLNNFMGLNSAEVQKTKQHAWAILKKVFPLK